MLRILRVLVLALLVSVPALAQETAVGLFDGEFAAPQGPVAEYRRGPVLPEQAPAPVPLSPLNISNSEGLPLVPPVPVAEYHVAEYPNNQYAYPALPADSYFLVSSRCSIQNIRSYDRWGLDVHQRFGNSALQPTDVPSMVSQFTPGVPVCIYVHGSFVQWESQCREAHEAHQVFRQICPGQPLQMIFYTWPSDGPYTYFAPIDVTVRGERSEFNGFHLAWLISQIPESCPICLISHSHGARAVLSTLHLAGGGTIQGHYFTGNMGARRYRVVLAAAAVDHNWLNPGQRYECALPRVDCLLNLRNRTDAVLAFYPLTRPFAHRALANAGFTAFDRWRLGSQLGKIREVDITRLVGPNHYWPNYYCDPEIAAIIRSYMVF